MMFRSITLFAALCCVAQATQAETVKKSASHAAAKLGSTKPVPKLVPAPKPWAPKPFNSAAQLPVGYEAEDAYKVYEIFAAASQKSKKDEFETTEAYQARMSNPDALLAPLSVSATYAFEYETYAKYNADAQVWTFGSSSSECSKPSYSEKADVRLCKVGKSVSTSEYEGSNSYGAKATITEYRGTYVDLAIAASALNNPFFKKEQYSESYSFSYSLPMPIDQASQLRGKKLSVLLVGNFTGTTLISGRGLYSKPTISEPQDFLIVEQGMPFHLTQVILFVKETGQILKSQSAE